VIHTAFPWDENFGQFLLTLDKQYDLVVDGRENIPFPIFPTSVWLLPFGGTDAGDVISWITGGLPEEWGVFVWGFPGVNTYCYKSLNLSEFLIEMLDVSSEIYGRHGSAEFFSPENRTLLVTD
jgi:hypothetical protein